MQISTEPSADSRLPPDLRKLRARERTREWREDNRKNGLCPKHATAVSLLGRCHKCTPEPPPLSPSVPISGELLSTCFQCTNCSSHFHKGSIYDFHPSESPRKKLGLVEGRSNSLLDYDDRDPNDYNRVWAQCGRCREEELDEWAYRNPSSWSGICKRHSQRARLETKRWRHKESGAIVLPSKRSPEPGSRQRKVKVAFICANKKKTVHGRHLGETYLSQTKRKKWRGLCAECNQCVADPKRKTQDEEIGDALTLRFSQSKEKADPVPIVYKICGHTRNAPRQTALAFLWAFRNKTQVPRGVCAGCVKNPAAMVKAQTVEGSKNEAWDARSVSIGQQHQKKAPRGRKPGDHTLDRQAAQRDFESIVTKLSEVRSEREITRRAITAEYHKRGELLDESAVTKRVGMIYGKGVYVAEAVAQVIRKQRV